MRYFLEISYKGTQYHGWQLQPNALSVQEVLINSVSLILQEEVDIIGAGRTDAGVHATQMFAHFDSNICLPDEFVYKLNSVLPDDIVIHQCFQVNKNAHARFDAVYRSYEYHIFLGRNPFFLETTWQLYQQTFDIEKMNTAASVLYDYTDFECFSKVQTDVKTFHCTIKNAEWKLDNNQLTFYITANRFLRNMVRAIVGTLLEVGLGKMSLEEFRSVIESKKRSNAGVSVPAKGLFLTEVKYKKDEIKVSQKSNNISNSK